MQYLSLPAFWYFISSFTFESRLFILVWRAQLDQRQMFDEQYLRKRLTWFYILFYIVCFLALMFQSTLLYQTWAILLFNATLWIPQIVHSYIKRSRKGPSMQFACALLAMQLFTPLYLKMDSGNFLDQETDRVSGMIIIFFLLAQLFILKRQQTNGARWFIPKRFRRSPLAHNYYHNIPASVLRRARLNEKDAPPTDEEVMCVICMNYCHFEVDDSGGLFRTDVI